jgi:hypothetical protein
MSWIATGLAVGGMVLGNEREKQKSKQIKAHNMGQAETTRYSPWTGMQGKMVMDDSDQLGGAFQGGLSGFQMGNNINKGLSDKPTVDDGGSSGGGMTDPPKQYSLTGPDELKFKTTPPAGNTASLYDNNESPWSTMLQKPGYMTARR